MSVVVNNPDIFQQRPAAVLFDLDNTLYRYGPAHEAGMKSVVEKATEKIGIDADIFGVAFDRARVDVKRQLGSVASSHSRLLYFQRTLEYLGLRSQVTLSLEFEQTYWRNFLSTIELRPGVVNFLDQLSRASISKVIVTDLTSQIQFRKLLYLDLDRRFEYVVTSEESGADKPDSAGFKLAMQKLSLTAGSVWMVGDNFVADIDGAKGAIGAATVGLKSEMGEYLSHPSLDMVFESFGDLKQFVTDSGWDNQTLV